MSKLQDLKASILNRLKNLNSKGTGVQSGGLSQWSAKLKKLTRNFDPNATIEWATKTLQKRGTAFYGTGATIVLSTFFIADLTSMLVDEYIPEPPTVYSRGNTSKPKTLADYNPIFTRNLFNSRGLIPGEDGAAVSGGAPAEANGIPVKTSLPFNLIGVLIMEDERSSIGTIEDKGANSTYPVQVGDEIPGKALILEIQPQSVIFLNKISNRKEFVELPEEPNAKNPRITLGKTSGTPGIEKVSPNQYNVARNEVDKALGDFNSLLTQARAVPNIENGVSAGYKLFQIVPGSLYEKLGLQNGDVITGVNGSPINDPGKAFEMIGELKTSSHLELQVKKDGKQMTYTYDIH